MFSSFVIGTKVYHPDVIPKIHRIGSGLLVGYDLNFPSSKLVFSFKKTFEITPVVKDTFFYKTDIPQLKFGDYFGVGYNITKTSDVYIFFYSSKNTSTYSIYTQNTKKPFRAYHLSFQYSRRVKWINLGIMSDIRLKPSFDALGRNMFAIFVEYKFRV